MRWRLFRGKSIRLRTIACAVLVLASICASPAFGDDLFPSEKITWICYVKPGGGFDPIARCISPYLEKYLKELSPGSKGGAVVVKNVPEGGGLRAFRTIYHAKPDGYTIGDFNTAFATETISSKIDFDYTRFTFLVRTGAARRVILVKKNSFKTWDEMIRAGREKELKWAASNFGRGHHVACILVKEFAKVPARLINFPGAAENTNALLRGDVHLAIASEVSAKPMMDAGEVMPLVVLSARSPFSGVPSIADLGYPELAEPLTLHYMVIGPPGLSSQVVKLFASAFQKTFSDKEFLTQAKKIGFEPEPLYGEDAEQLARNLFKFYEEKAPILQKYLR